MACEFEEKETYVYLDFDGKIDPESIEKSRPFFRLAGLETANPVVQLNDFLFKGKYTDCVGTNLFFKEEENTQNDSEINCFKNETAISLDLFLSQSKVLEMKPVKVQAKAAHTRENTNMNLNFDQDYNATLKKLAAGSLNLEDLMVLERSDGKEKQPDVAADETIAHGDESEENLVTMNDINEYEKIEIQDIHLDENPSSVVLEKQLDHLEVPKESENPVLLEKYQRLQRLSRTPVHREIEPELVKDCANKYRKSFEYHNIERQIFQRSNSFAMLDFSTDCNTPCNFVDVDRCILYGIMKTPRERHKLLTQEEKNKLLKIENFEFLSLPARLSVLQQELKHLEKYVTTANKSELQKADKYNRTPLDTVDIIKKLVTNLERYLITVKTFLESEDMKQGSDNQNKLCIENRQSTNSMETKTVSLNPENTTS